MTSRDVIFQFDDQKVLTEAKITMMGHPLCILSIEHYNRFNLRGEPLFYDKWLTSYRLFSERPVFAEISTKLLTPAKIMTSR